MKIELTDVEKHYIQICLRDAEISSNIWVKLIAHLWQHILLLEEYIKEKEIHDPL